MSTFAFETVDMMRQSKWGLCVTNVMAQNALCIMLVFAAMWAGRALFAAR